MSTLLPQHKKALEPLARDFQFARRMFKDALKQRKALALQQAGMEKLFERLRNAQVRIMLQKNELARQLRQH